MKINKNKLLTVLKYVDGLFQAISLYGRLLVSFGMIIVLAIYGAHELALYFVLGWGVYPFIGLMISTVEKTIKIKLRREQMVKQELDSLIDSGVLEFKKKQVD